VLLPPLPATAAAAAAAAAAQGRHQEVCGRLDVVWQWSKVPAHWDKVAVAEWLGTAGPPATGSNPATMRTWLNRVEKDVQK